MMALCKEEVGNFTLPFMAVHGASDQVCLPEGSEFLFRAAATPVTDKKLVMYPGLRHEPMHEPPPGGPNAIRDAVEYFGSFLVLGPLGGSIATAKTAAADKCSSSSSSVVAVSISIEAASGATITREEAYAQHAMAAQSDRC